MKNQPLSKSVHPDCHCSAISPRPDIGDQILCLTAQDWRSGYVDNQPPNMKDRCLSNSRCTWFCPLPYCQANSHSRTARSANPEMSDTSDRREVFRMGCREYKQVDPRHGPVVPVHLSSVVLPPIATLLRLRCESTFLPFGHSVLVTKQHREEIESSSRLSQLPCRVLVLRQSA